MFNKFIHRPVLSIVISLIITFLGVLALTKMPVTQLLLRIFLRSSFKTMII
jgi:multidrug efflux pump subunit AcrB